MNGRSSTARRARGFSVVVLLVVGVLSAGCVKPDEPPQPPLGNWRITGYYNADTGAMAALVPGSGIHLTLGADGRLEGVACNVYGGLWLLDGDRFTVSDLWSHARACGSPEGVDGQEHQYFEALRAVNRAEVREGTLLLYGDDRQLVRAVRA